MDRELLEKLDKALKDLEILLLYEGNVDIYNKVTEFVKVNYNLDEKEFKEGVSPDKIHDKLVFNVLEDLIFKPVLPVYIFAKKPLKCVEWIKVFLSKYEKTFSSFLLKMIIIVLNDFRRFPKNIPQLKIIISKLNSFDIDGEKESPKENIGWIKFFTGGTTLPIKDFIEAHLSIHGFLASESEIVREFVNEHKEEVISQFKHEISAINIKDDKPERFDFTRRKLEFKILELTQLNGYESPKSYLNELHDKVKLFNDNRFENDFFLNIHYLCKEHSKKFWSDYHKKEITNWLKSNAPIVTNVFNGTWKETFNELSDKENQFCQSMPITFAIDHFKVFAEQKSKNGQSFLTEDQLNSFIKRAFLDENNIEKQFINISKRENLFIVKRFYQFYDNSWEKFEKNQHCRDKYIQLLTENFENWDFQKVKNNFGNKVKRDW